MTVTIFLPCRKGSERIPQKNTKPFAGLESGLVELKLSQLLATKRVDRIVLSTDDELILEFAKNWEDPRLDIHQRDEDLASGNTSTDQLVGLALQLIPTGSIVWTHVTSPFVSGARYDDLIATYEGSLEDGYDSLMTVSSIRGFLWTEAGPLNYDRSVEKWPRTQSLEPVYEVNSAAFIAPASIYEECHDRIGNVPYLFELEAFEGFDIDWPEQFQLAEVMVEQGLAEVNRSRLD